MMEENVTSLLLYMINRNTLSDPTLALLKVASHEPAGVAQIEFVASKQLRGDKYHQTAEASLTDFLALSINGRLGFDWMIGSHGDEITPPRAPVPRKPILDAQEILERLPDDRLRTILRPDHRKFCEIFVPSFTPWTLALDAQTSNRPRAQNGPGHHNDDPKMVQKVRR